MPASTLRRLLLGACLVPLFSACSSDLPSTASPSDADALEAGLVGATLRLSSGAGQMGLPGRPLSNPIIVRVLNAAGAPVADAAVGFTAPAGSGVEPGQARTDARGYASAVWTLGAVGPQTLRVSAAGTTVEVAATGRKGSGALTSLVKTGGDGQGALPGAPLQSPLQVRVLRDDGTPVHDAALTWTASAGTLDRTASRSSSTGYSAVRWTLGPDGGAQTLTVAAPGVAPVVFRATARGLRLIKMSGDDPAAAGVSAFSTAPSRERMVEVRAVRLDGTPAGGAEVTWTLSGGGTVDRPVTRAGTNGYTHVLWTLGAGAQKLTASAPGAVPVVFETVGPPVPSILRIKPELLRVTAGQTGQVTATLHDNQGNQIHGYVYEWSTSDPALATVDSEGVVQGVTAGRGKIFVRTAGLEWEIPLTVEPRLSEVRFVDQQHWQRMDQPYEGFDVSNGEMHIRTEVGVLARVDSLTIRLRGPGGEVVEPMRGMDKWYVGSELVWGISTYIKPEFLIPAGAEPGVWRVDRVVLFRNGESAVYTYADFEAVDLHGRAFDVRGAGVDVSPPEVRTVWPWHHTGRIEGVPGWYFVQLGIQDHVSGAVSATATFRGPQGQTLSCQLDPRVAYDCSLPIPEGSGTWELVSVYAIDAAGNSATYTPQDIQQWNGPFTYNFITYTFET